MQYNNTASSAPLIKNQDNHIPLSSPSDMPSVHVDEIPDMEKEAEKKKVARAAMFRQIRMFAFMIFIDIGLPLVIYYVLENFISELIALILSGIPPLLHVIVNFIRKRRIEVVGCICIFSFFLSAVLTLISGDARLALLRDSTTTAVISLAFFITLIPLRTPWFKLYPLTFLIYQQMTSELPPLEWIDYDGQHHSMARSEFSWEHISGFRKSNYIMTTAWGSTLMAEFIAKVIMIEATTLSVDQIMLYGTIIVAVLFATLAITTTIITHKKRKIYIAFIDEWIKTNDYSSKYPSRKPVGSDNLV